MRRTRAALELQKKHGVSVSTQVTPKKVVDGPAISRAEKQKLYRQRKIDELGFAEFRRLENERLRKYKPKMSDMSPTAKHHLQLQNRIRHLRRRKQQAASSGKTGKIIVFSDSSDSSDDNDDATITEEDEEESTVNEGGLDEDVSTPLPDLNHRLHREEQTPSGNGTLTFTPSIPKGVKGTRKRTSRVVSKKNRHISQLEKELKNTKKKYEKFKKSSQRLKSQIVTLKSFPSLESFDSSTRIDTSQELENSGLDISATAETSQECENAGLDPSPRTQTYQELENAGLNPSSSKIHGIRKKLMFANSVGKEVKSVVDANPVKKGLITKVICGETTKKYRFKSTVSKLCGISRRQIDKMGNDKQLLEQKRFRMPMLRANLRRKVSEFLSRDDNSRQNPGKKDCIKTSKDDKEKTQTRVLHHYMYELYKKFIGEHGRIMSKASFYRCRPKHILLAKHLCRRTCLCTKHQNMALKLQGIKKLLLLENVNTNAETFIKDYSTDRHIETLLDELEGETQLVKYEEWNKMDVVITVRKEDRKVKKWKLIQKEDEIHLFRTVFTSEVSEFRKHSYRVFEQFNQMKNLREVLPIDHATIQIDFAENFTCQENAQIQSDYFGDKVQITLHPCVANLKQDDDSIKPYSAVFITPVLKHDKVLVRVFLKRLVKQLLEF